MPESPVVQLRVPADTLGVIDELRGEQTRSGWILDLITQELDGPAEHGPRETRLSAPATLPVTHGAQPGGIPSPGVACAWPTCWVRETSRYGVTSPAELLRTDYRDRPRDEEACGLVLCPAHSGRLAGFRFVRPTAAPRAASKASQPA